MPSFPQDEAKCIETLHLLVQALTYPRLQLISNKREIRLVPERVYFVVGH